MNTREQLIHYLESAQGNEQIVLKTYRFTQLLEKLIAERPYEPGGEILIGRTSGTGIFLCVDPVNSDVVWALPLGADKAERHALHKPLPKTYRVTVPEEIMEAAKTHAEYNETAADEVCVWLANPENWEAEAGDD